MALNSEVRTNGAAPRALAPLFAALLLLAVAAPPAALSQRQPSPQQTPPPDIIDEEDVLRIDTDMVLVEVTVTDAAGKPARGLRAEDFKLYDDGEERPIAFINVERKAGAERPVAVVFAVDVSGSMTAEEMAKLRGAMRAFSEKLSNRPASFALMSFGMSSRA